jgi:hypothetical protein
MVVTQPPEKVESVTSAAKAADENKVLTAALKRCATRNQTFSAVWKAVPFPGPSFETSSTGFGGFILVSAVVGQV